MLFRFLCPQSYSTFQQVESTKNDFNDDRERTLPAETFYGESEHVLVVLDCDPAMFEPYIPNDNEKQPLPLSSPMEISLDAISKLFQTRMAESKTGMRNEVGVLLYGSDASRLIQNRQDDQISTSTCELVRLSPPGIEQIMTIQACKQDLEGTSAIGQLRRKRKEVDECVSLKSALYEANEIFMRAK